MKKTFLLISIVAINYTSFGQRIDIGIKGGVNFSKLEIPDISTSNKTGYHFRAYSFQIRETWYSARVYFFSAGIEG